ncbi:hypothetical protein [Thioalkalivibrio sp. ALJ1]|uniref:hypothetical protein n=1 Tax=Thioalkalivibrio sp. ALJ1 TaxID=1158144 RepID=UPI00056E554A|nr:hypothetical protein [Thioalkalivibrio sp. ALJ1]
MSTQHVLQQIADAVGFQAAHQLAIVRGGMTFFVPANPPPHHWLRSVMDDEAVEKLAEAFGGGNVSLPPLRDQTTHRIEIALRNKIPVRTVSLLVGLSERRVHGVRKELEAMGRLPSDAA